MKRTIIATALLGTSVTAFAANFVSIVDIEESNLYTEKWTKWADLNSFYACSSWSPLPSAIPYGDSFTQQRDCSQDQVRTKGGLNETKTIDKTYNKSSIGTDNFITSIEVETWSLWADDGVEHSCTTWSPSTSTVNSGVSFTQSSDCKKDQTRTRNSYDIWSDGARTFRNVENQSQTIDVSKTQQNTGMKNFLQGSETGSWTSWTDSAALTSCSSWSPLTSTVNLGSDFTQTSDCKQEQTRTRPIYDVWVDGSKTINHSENESQSADVSKTQSNTGTKNFKTNETEIGAWSHWVDVNSVYNCGDWLPEQSTVGLDIAFTQSLTCDQDQMRQRSILDLWADGTKTFNSSENETQTLSTSEEQESVGTKLVIQKIQLALNNQDHLDNLGSVMDIDGDYMVSGIGYKNENKGTAVVHKKINGTWVEQQFLYPTTRTAGAAFGSSVAIKGDTIVVGESGTNSVYTFTRSGESWTQKSKITGPANSRLFGSSIDFDGQNLIVGDPNYNPVPFVCNDVLGLCGLNELSYYSKGIAHAYNRSGNNWTGRTSLQSNTPKVGERFGMDITLESGKAFIKMADGDHNVINTYTKSGSSWAKGQVLSNDIAENMFYAKSISYDGNTLLVSSEKATSELTKREVFLSRYKSSGTNWVKEGHVTGLVESSFSLFGPMSALNLGALAIKDDIILLGNRIKNETLVFKKESNVWSETTRVPLSGTSHITDSQFIFGYSTEKNADDDIVGAIYTHPIE